MRRFSVLAVGAIFASVLSASPSHAAVTGSDGSCGARQVRTMMAEDGGASFETAALRTFHLVMEAEKKTYKVGQTAIVKATVTRPAHEDPLQLGVTFDPPQSYAAEGVNVGVGVRVGDVFLFGYGITDENGKTDIKVKIQPYTRPGTAVVDGFAWLRQLETPCLTVEENGYTFAPGLFKVVKL